MATEIGVVAPSSLDDTTELKGLHHLELHHGHADAPASSREKDVDPASTLHDPLPRLSVEFPIVYHYLTFETQLPSPPFAHPSENNALRLNPPPCPSLRDFENPFDWSRSRKTFVTLLSCAVTITAAYSAGSYEYAADQLTAKWKISSVAFNTGITIFTFGFGIAPMALAPFSEEYGRRPVFLASGLLYVGKWPT